MSKSSPQKDRQERPKADRLQPENPKHAELYDLLQVLEELALDWKRAIARRVINNGQERALAVLADIHRKKSEGLYVGASEADIRVELLRLQSSLREILPILTEIQEENTRKMKILAYYLSSTR